MQSRNVKGTKDLFGKETRQFQFVENIFSSIAESFGYQEMRPPVLEHSEVFVRGVGEGSDVVRKEMYTFLDKGERSLTLRPEFTAGIMRLIVQNKLYATETLPIKAYYNGPVFRYERPQLGRYRQFNQFGVECVGGTSYFNDLETIMLGYCMLSTLGLTNVTLKINTLGDEASREAYKTALKNYFADKIEDMCEDCKDRFNVNPLRILDCKVPEDQEIVKGAPKMSDYLSEESKERFENILNALTQMEIPYEVDDTLVRGLDYYSETVFEFHYTSKKGVNYGAIGAGGHYSNLVKEFGGPELEGVGFSFGEERIVSVLNDDELLNELNEEGEVEFYICPICEEAKEPALALSVSSRMMGARVDVNFEGGKLGAMLKKAVKKGALYAIIIGEDELNKNSLQMKNLVTEEQTELTVSEYLDAIKQMQEHDHECHCHDDEDGCEDGECCCHHHHKDEGDLN